MKYPRTLSSELVQDGPVELKSLMLKEQLKVQKEIKSFFFAKWNEGRSG